MGWARQFDEPIPLPKGKPLVTLRDAAHYITKLPKAEHDAPEWQAAMEALLIVAERGGPTMFARIGLMLALNRHVVPVLKVRERRRIGESGSLRGTNENRADLRQHQQGSRRH
jgi:hypothetical protein